MKKDSKQTKREEFDEAKHFIDIILHAQKHDMNGFVPITIPPDTDIQALRDVLGDPTWKSADGRLTLYSQMAQSHLVNTIKKIRNDPVFRELRGHKLQRLELEYAIRAEVARRWNLAQTLARQGREADRYNELMGVIANGG